MQPATQPASRTAGQPRLGQLRNRSLQWVVQASLIVEYSVVGMVVQCRATYVIIPQVVVQPGSLHVGLLAGWAAASASWHCTAT